MPTTPTDLRIPRRPADRLVLRDGYTLLMRIASLRSDLSGGCSDAYDHLEARVRRLLAETEAAAL